MEKQKKEPLRKTGAKWGARTQKMMTFRIDLDVAEMLETVANKGRVVNDAVREFLKATNRKRTHEAPETTDIPMDDE